MSRRLPPQVSLSVDQPINRQAELVPLEPDGFGLWFTETAATLSLTVRRSGPKPCWFAQQLPTRLTKVWPDAEVRLSVAAESTVRFQGAPPQKQSSTSGESLFWWE